MTLHLFGASRHPKPHGVPYAPTLPYNTGRVRIGAQWHPQVRSVMDADAVLVQRMLLRRNTHSDALVVWSCTIAAVALGALAWWGRL